MLKVDDLSVKASEIGNKALLAITTTAEQVTDKVSDIPDTVKETTQQVKTRSKNIIEGLSENKNMLLGIMAVSAFGIGYLSLKK